MAGWPAGVTTVGSLSGTAARTESASSTPTTMRCGAWWQHWIQGAVASGGDDGVVAFWNPGEDRAGVVHVHAPRGELPRGAGRRWGGWRGAEIGVGVRPSGGLNGQIPPNCCL